MSATLPIETMSLEEKLRTMEAIWDNLCRQEATVPVPPWHDQILDERTHAIAEGRTGFTDFETARREILERTRR